MNDIYSLEKRSKIMARIRTTGTKPELVVRQVTHGLGYRFRIHGKGLPGKPNLVFPRYRKVIFVHGCFWHGHMHCAKAKRPATNITFWEQKLSRNMDRDQQIKTALLETGWGVMIIWECETKDRDRLAGKIRCFFQGNSCQKEIKA